MRKEIYIDVETTGLDKESSAIWQLAGDVVINNQSKERFDFRIKPHEGFTHSDIALKMNDLTLDELEEFTPPNIVFAQFEALLKKYVSPYDKKDKFIFKAYNAGFDSDFIRAFFKRNGSNYYGSYFWVPPYDIMSVAILALEDDRPELPNFKLETVARFLGIKVSSASFHDAEYDIEISRLVDHKAKELIKKRILS